MLNIFESCRIPDLFRVKNCEQFPSFGLGKTISLHISGYIYRCFVPTVHAGFSAAPPPPLSDLPPLSQGEIAQVKDTLETIYGVNKGRHDS